MVDRPENIPFNFVAASVQALKRQRDEALDKAADLDVALQAEQYNNNNLRMYIKELEAMVGTIDSELVGTSAKKNGAENDFIAPETATDG